MVSPFVNFSVSDNFVYVLTNAFLELTLKPWVEVKLQEIFNG